MRKHWRLLFLAVLLGGGFALRAPFFHREIWNIDEGGTLTAAQQVLGGDVLYRDVADHRAPLMPYLKAVMLAIVGDWNGRGVRAGVMLLLGFSAVGLWRLSRRLGDEPAGIGASLFFVLSAFLVPNSGDEMAMHTEWFLIAFSIGAFAVYSQAKDRPGLSIGFCSGLLFGLAAACKQPGLLDFGVSLVLTLILILSGSHNRPALWRMLVGQFAGVAAVGVLTVAYFAYHHAMADCIFYAWTYNSRYYVPEVPFDARLDTIQQPFRLFVEGFPVALGLGLAALVLLLPWIVVVSRRLPRRTPLLEWLILGWTASGIISTALSGRSFSHYSIQVLPGFSLACGWAAGRMWEWSRKWRWLRGLVIAGGLAAGVFTGFKVAAKWRRLNTNDGDFHSLAALVQRHTKSDERIFVWGYAPEIYYKSRRLPSSRFINTNFLTGLIPWTNLDPLKDTSYAVVPGSWEQLRADFARRPPAMIVDTCSLHGYLKYPLAEQGWLGETLIKEFAAIETHSQDTDNCRFYRRLAPCGGQTLPRNVVESGNVQLDLSFPRRRFKVPLAAVSSGDDVHAVALFAGDRMLQKVEYNPSVPCDVTFFVDPHAFPAGNPGLRAAVYRSNSVEFSGPVDLQAFLAEDALRGRPGPPLTCGADSFLPVETESIFGVASAPASNGRWPAHLPSLLVYSLPPSAARLKISYGLDENCYYKCDGFYVQVLFEPSNGAPRELFRRLLIPRSQGCDQGTQTSEIALPVGEPGRILLRAQPGPTGSMSFGWFYWKSIVAEGAAPPHGN